MMSTYFLLGAIILVSSVLLLNFVGSLFVASFWHLIKRVLVGRTADTCARVAFGLRVAPLTLSLVTVFGFFLPAYVVYEPINSGESITPTLFLIGMLALASIVIAVVRIVRTLVATSRLSIDWARNATPMAAEMGDLEVFRFIHASPIVAVVGLFKPCVFVADVAAQRLSDVELAAVLAHERGHVRGRDNLKRILMRLAKDTLLIPIGRDLDRFWAVNAEAAADDFAAGRSVDRALDLASAIIKLARGSRLPSPSVIGAFLVEDDQEEVAARVRRLTRKNDFSPSSGQRSGNSDLLLLAASLPIASALHFFEPTMLFKTHLAIESLVRITQ